MSNKVYITEGTFIASYVLVIGAGYGMLMMVDNMLSTAIEDYINTQPKYECRLERVYPVKPEVKK